MHPNLVTATGGLTHAPNPANSLLLHSALSVSADATWRDLIGRATPLVRRAFDEQDPEAELIVHRLLYSLYTARILAPWSAHWYDVEDPGCAQLRHTLETAWERHDRLRFAAEPELPRDADALADWAAERCHADRSNPDHPLFHFLSEEATFDQLREFLLQETPFDIHFGDILSLMLLGIYGQAKAELAQNFWDEMGHGRCAESHRALRLSMMSAVGIDPEVHITGLERFCLEELRLANMYFHAAFNRRLIPQAIGMMLATELMVPGRIERQIAGWRRVGLPDDSMVYLHLHTHIDVEHARGWRDEVVLPLLSSQPQLMGEVALGLRRRLAYATDVCDRMLTLLPQTRAQALEGKRPLGAPGDASKARGSASWAGEPARGA